jgi:deaminated glutathione amidase
VPEFVPEQEKLANTSVMFGPDGEQRAVYRKLHMFDVEVGDVEYRESAIEQAGDQIAVGEAGGAMVGLTICYDLRFPELYRILTLRGARVITVPSAFTERTGRDHWEILIRARAIEDQVFVIAAGQIGFAPPHYRSYGRSMIVDPWGVVMAQAPDTECFVSADLDFTIQNEMRDSLPSLRHRRPDAYGWPEDDDAIQASTAEPAAPAGAP